MDEEHDYRSYDKEVHPGLIKCIETMSRLENQAHC